MGLNGLFCHTVVVALANNFLLVGENFVTKKLNLFFRCSLHILIASLVFYRGLPKLTDTYFSDLGLPITATHSEILKSYDNIQNFIKTVNPEVAARVKRAYEVLSNEETRILYSMYGDVGIDAKTPLDFTLIVITVSLSYYVISCIVCCVFNRSNRLKFAKYVSILYNAVAFFMEIELRFLYATFMRNIFYLNRLLPFQHIEFLRAMPPFVTIVVALLSHFFVPDLDKLNMFLWQSTVATNSVILEKMSHVVCATEYLKSMGRAFVKPCDDDTPREDQTKANFGEFLESLDENQKKRLMELVTTEDTKSKKGKTARLFELAKPFAVYFVMFFLFRVFLK